MKKKTKITIFLVAIAIICVAIVLPFALGKSENAKIIVATDTHYLSSQVNDNGIAFNEMLENSDGKLTQYCDEIFSSFSDEVIAEKPDALIISGDLTFNGEKASHEDFVKKLNVIKNSGVPVLTIPGNHDINRTCAGYFGEEYVQVDTISPDDYKNMYFDFGIADAESVDEHSFSYLYKINKDLYVLMLDTNAYGVNFVQDNSYEWIEQQLKLVKKQHAKVITVSHQNLYAHNEQLSLGYQLYDAEELLELLTKYKVKCHLSGHIHLQHIMDDDVCEIVTESMLIAPCKYGEIRFDGKINYQTRQIDVATWARNNGIKNDDLLNFDNFSPVFFKQNGTSRTMAQLKDTNLTPNDLDLMAKAFGELNYCYFSGIKCDTEPIENGIELWENQSDFSKKYIETMREEAQKDYNKIFI